MADEEETKILQRRIRHITCIQLRNLTPFPVRDAFASALSKPAEQSQFTAQGNLSDDLDVTLSRKRSRRISASSLFTLRSLKSDDSDEPAHAPDLRGHRRAASKASSGIRPNGSPSVAAATIRPSHRKRTSSLSSSMHITLPPIAAPLPSTPSAFMPLSAMLPDNTQLGLEKVIKSRLIETFLAISVPSRPAPKALSKPTTPTQHKFGAVGGKPNGIVSPVPRKSVKPSPLNTVEQSTPKSHASPRPAKIGHVKSASTSALRLNGKSAGTPSPVSSPTKSSLSPSNFPPTPPRSLSPIQASTPNYLSPIHRPSTNPSFPLTRFDFAEHTDFSSNKLKVEIWGKVDSDSSWRQDSSSTGKGKEKERQDDALEWSVLEEWEIQLDDLVPLPAELSARPSQLPSNTLSVTLTPPGEIFYLPRDRLMPPSRASSPAPGYNSDPESEVRKVKQTEPVGDSVDLPTHDIVALSRRRLRRGGDKTSQNTVVKSSGWQDLFNLVTRQSHILDNETSLANVVRQVDKILEKDHISPLKRDASERQAFLDELRSEEEGVRARSLQLKDDIAARRVGMRRRREMLSMAREQEERQALLIQSRKDEVSEQRNLLRQLRSGFTPIRTSLLATLSTIFPIDLYSPPDLLFTILNVPLPIPLTATDPAPPLLLPAHKEVTEEAVATSLGYAAQAVYFLSAYTGKTLIYPITCMGSRSYIKDVISAMVGPRMFPLFSKGMDTYRFEYAVYLLNKDIEMLMADRDLRALDMRHTLPNLKNLLLTLTDGEVVEPEPERPISKVVLEVVPPAMPANADSKKTSSFLGFTGFLRGRYPSTTWTSMGKTSDIPQEDTTVTPANGEYPDEDEDGDRRTIRGGDPISSVPNEESADTPEKAQAVPFSLPVSSATPTRLAEHV